MRDFDKEAAEWETLPRVKLAQDVAAAVMAAVALRPDMDVLDFGCGTGLVSQALKSKVRSVAGADTSKGMLEQYKHKLGAKTVLLEPGKETSLGGTYDLIVSSMALHHVPQIEPLLKSFYGALKPGGYVAVADLDEEGGRFHPDPTGVFHQGFRRQELERMFREAGFSGVRSAPAASITKPAVDGAMETFTIFLMIGQR